MGVGIDTLALVGPAGANTLYELARITHQRHVDFGTGEIVDHGHFGNHSIVVRGTTVGIVAWEGHLGVEMRIQASVPRLLRGHNWDGAGPEELPSAVGLLLDSVARALPGAPQPHEVRVSRVDLTRDFVGVRDPAATLSAISKHPMPWATVNQQYLRRDGQLQTLMRGNRNHWLARGYDKSYEALHGSAGGLQRELASRRPRQLRFELELRSKELRRRGFTTVEDLLAADLTRLTRDYFERCKFDVNTAHTGMADLVEELTADGVSPAQRRNLIVYLTCLRHGVRPMLSRGPFEEARALANRYKLSPESLATSTFVRRLDFDRACELVE